MRHRRNGLATAPALDVAYLGCGRDARDEREGRGCAGAVEDEFHSGEES